MALLMFSALFASWLGINGPIDISVIKEWQTLIGFTGTLAVGVVAWVNVSRQLQQQRVSTRLTLLSREEDRIEKELPGLKDAEILCHFIRSGCINAIETEPFFARVKEALQAIGFKSVHTSVDIAILPPATDSKTRRDLQSRVQVIQLRCEISRRVEGEARAAEKEKLRKEIEEVATFRNSLSNRQTSLQGRLPKIRSEIETTLLNYSP